VTIATAPIEPPVAGPATVVETVDTGLRTRQREGRAPRTLVASAIVVGLIFAAPFAYLVWRNAELGADFGEVLGSELARTAIRNTLTLATTVTLAATVVGTALAWLVVRTDLPLRRVWAAVLPLPLVIPSFVGGLALLAAFAPGGLVAEALGPLGVDHLPDVRGFTGAFTVMTLLTFPYVYLPVAARLRALPSSIEEGARALGRRPFAVLRTVVLPQIAGSIWAGALIVFLYVLSEFGAVILLGYPTLTTAIYRDKLLDPADAAVYGLTLGLLALACVTAERVITRRRLPFEAVSTAPVRPAPLGRAKPLAIAFMTVVVLLALVLPIAVLVQWTSRGFTGDRLGGDGVGSAGVAAAAWNTAWISVVAGLVTLAVVVPLAFLSGRFRSRVSAPASVVVTAGFALPGLVTALALVTWTLQTSVGAAFYQTMPMLVLAYVVHFGAQALRAGHVAVAAVPRRLDDAARSLGAGRWRRLRTIDGPLMVPGMATGFGMVLMSVMKELPATLLLAPIGFSTLATEIYGTASEGFYARAGFRSLWLILVSGVLTWLLVIRPQSPPEPVP
jgi:iron(III) transport system permease protein